MGKPKGIKRYNNPRKPGSTVQYSLEQRDRYLSLQNRITRACEIVDLIQEIPSGDEQRSLYFHPSDRAAAGGYTVTVIEQPPREPDSPVPAPPGEPPPGALVDTWNKSRAVFGTWHYVEYVRYVGYVSSWGTGLPAHITATDTTVNDWRLRNYPLTSDSPPYPYPVSVANLANEVYTLPDDYVTKFFVTRTGIVTPGGDMMTIGGAASNSFIYTVTLYAETDISGRSLNELDAARTPYWVGQHLIYGLYRQVSDGWGSWREQYASVNLYTFRCVGFLEDVPAALNLTGLMAFHYRPMVGGWTRDSPWVSRGLTARDIFPTGSAIAARIPAGDDGVDPVKFNQPYSPSSPKTPEDLDPSSEPPLDPSEPDQPSDPDLPIDPGRPHYSCNCPDYTRVEPRQADSRYQSRHRDRVWVDSDAGSPIYYVGDQEVIYCKHILATMLRRGEPLP